MPAQPLLQTPALIDEIVAVIDEQFDLPVEALVSTDDNMYLEYATPRGNVLPEGEPFLANVRWLSAYGRRRASP